MSAVSCRLTAVHRYATLSSRCEQMVRCVPAPAPISPHALLLVMCHPVFPSQSRSTPTKGGGGAVILVSARPEPMKLKAALIDLDEEPTPLATTTAADCFDSAKETDSAAAPPEPDTAGPVLEAETEGEPPSPEEEEGRGRLGVVVKKHLEPSHHHHHLASATSTDAPFASSSALSIIDLHPPVRATSPATTLTVETPTTMSRRLLPRHISGDTSSRLLLQPTPTEPRRVSRPSTPISRTTAATVTVNTVDALGGSTSPLFKSSSSPRGSPVVDSLGWPVAPNSAAYLGDVPTLTIPASSSSTLSSTSTLSTLSLSLSSTLSSARASRRRSAGTLIPETIQEKIKRKDSAAAANHTPVESLLPSISNPPSRRGSGAGLPLLSASPSSATLTKVSSRPHLLLHQMQQQHQQSFDSDSPRLTPSTGWGEVSHRSDGRRSAARGGGGGGDRGLSSSSSSTRVEPLTPSQERLLRERSYLWTDPRLWRHHLESCFAHYATLPVHDETASLASFSSPAHSTAPTPISSVPALPSIHHNDRIVYPQLQRLAKDCVQQLYLLVRKEVREEEGGTVASAKDLDKRTWHRLESLLPGHGNEAQTLQFTSLYLLDALAKTTAGSVGRREFLLLFPSVHTALFSLVSRDDTAAMRERRKVLQACYKLKLHDLLQPRPSTSLDHHHHSSNLLGEEGADLVASPHLSPAHRHGGLGVGGGSDRRRTSGEPFSLHRDDRGHFGARSPPLPSSSEAERRRTLLRPPSYTSFDLPPGASSAHHHHRSRDDSPSSPLRYENVFDARTLDRIVAELEPSQNELEASSPSSPHSPPPPPTVSSTIDEVIPITPNQRGSLRTTRERSSSK